MAQTQDKGYTERNVQLAFHSAVPASAAVIYAGALVGLTGANARQLAAADTFVGMAEEYVDNSGGSAGDKKVKVVAGHEVKVSVAGSSASTPGTKVYASDSETFTVTAQSNSLVGVLTEQVSGTTWFVKLLTVAEVVGV